MDENTWNIHAWMPLVAAATGAFLGAFFVFYVSQVNERIKRNHIRWFKHRNALVALEYQLNEILGIVADIRSTARSALDSASTSDNAVVIIWTKPQTLPRNQSFLTALLRLEMINELFSYDQQMRKVNHDTRMIRQAYAQMRNAFLRKNLLREQYLQSLQEFRDNLQILIKAYDLIDNRTMKLLARTRATLKGDMIHDKNTFFKMPIPADISEDAISDELSSLEKEIVEVRSISRSEIKQYLGEKPPKR